jgi:glutaminyl-tRNA synthetase
MEDKSLNFLEEIIENDLKSGKHNRVHTRFPPEPNGYLHIGHAKSICLNFGLAQKYGGKCNLRFDDTNPIKEEMEYVESIREDVKWLGFQWDGEYFASDYFQQLYDWAIQLIKDGKAYVCDLTQEQISIYRGTPQTPGTESPDRNRSVEENLNLFERMKNGEFPNGSRTLRAKIDLASPNMQLRDPVLYRILHAEHHRTGNDWCIYPMYDYAHGQSDSIEKITHSICTLEFDVHRPLYDWFIKELNIFPSHQYEFARLNINYTVMSKRKLLQMVENNSVWGWDDPRMPTISGLRRRGYTPASIRLFAEKIGVSKRDNVIDVGLLEWCVREDLNKTSQRLMAVLNPLKVVITNYPEGQTEELDAINNPENPDAGTRKVPFSRELYIEREDFMEVPEKKFFRLAPGVEVRLRYAYYITCNEVVKDENGHITELRCTYDPQTKGGGSPDGRKVKATLHWVSANHAVDAEVRLFDRLFAVADPENVNNVETQSIVNNVETQCIASLPESFINNLNPNSLQTLTNCKIEPFVASTALCRPKRSLSGAEVSEIETPITHFQFERLGYFVTDKDSTAEHLVFNRTVSLKDSK